MGRDRAAYMREYRAKKRTTTEPLRAEMWTPSGDFFAAMARIGELEAEVAHLKQELALRAPRVVLPVIDRFGVARPAPKPSQRHDRRSAMNAERPK